MYRLPALSGSDLSSLLASYCTVAIVLPVLYLGVLPCINYWELFQSWDGARTVLLYVQYKVNTAYLYCITTCHGNIHTMLHGNGMSIIIRYSCTGTNSSPFILEYNPVHTTEASRPCDRPSGAQHSRSSDTVESPKRVSCVPPAQPSEALGMLDRSACLAWKVVQLTAGVSVTDVPLFPLML